MHLLAGEQAWGGSDTASVRLIRKTASVEPIGPSELSLKILQLKFAPRTGEVNWATGVFPIL